MSSSAIMNWSGRISLNLNAHDLGEGGTQAVRLLIITPLSLNVNVN